MCMKTLETYKDTSGLGVSLKTYGRSINHSGNVVRRIMTCNPLEVCHSRDKPLVSLVSYFLAMFMCLCACSFADYLISCLLLA